MSLEEVDSEKSSRSCRWNSVLISPPRSWRVGGPRSIASRALRTIEPSSLVHSVGWTWVMVAILELQSSA